MKTKTNVKAGAMNHNETLRGGLKLKTHVKDGGRTPNHNETLACRKVAWTNITWGGAPKLKTAAR